MTTNDFYRVASLVQSSDYKAVFDLSGSATTVPLKRQFRLLAQHVQPETVVTSPVHDAATDVMQRLTAHYQAAQRASQGKVDELRFTTSSGTHVTTAGVAHADMATCFLSTSTIDGHERSSFVKLAATTRDNDLLAAEATALTKLATDGDPARAMFYPQLLDSFAHLGHERLRGNVLARLDGFYNLVDVKQAYPRGVHPLDMTWMWRRLLWALDGAHTSGLIHGAVAPPNVMILPAGHGVVLVDWCYSLLTATQPLRAVVGAYREWYPADSLAKAPARPGIDIVLAARTMVWLMGGEPRTGQCPGAVPAAMQTYFTDLISGRRPTNTVADVALRFEAVLQTLGAPYFPRKFRPFSL